MPTEILTTDDLREFRAQLLEDFERLLKTYNETPRKKWLKSFEVMTMLNITWTKIATHPSYYYTFGTDINYWIKGKYYGLVYFRTIIYNKRKVNARKRLFTASSTYRTESRHCFCN